MATFDPFDCTLAEARQGARDVDAQVHAAMRARDARRETVRELFRNDTNAKRN